MTAVRKFNLFGLDLSAYVENWGSIEEVKDIFLTSQQVFSGEMTITLGDGVGIFTPGGSASCVPRRGWFNSPGEVLLDGVVVFRGILKNIMQTHETRQVSFVFENLFSRPSEIPISYIAGVGENAVLMLLGLYQRAGLGAYVDTQSFITASGPMSAAGVMVLANYTEVNKTTLLGATRSVAELCGVSVFVSGGYIRARAFTPYTGGGLKHSLTDSMVRSFGSREVAFQSFYTGAKISYSTDSLTAESASALSLNGGVSKINEFSTGSDAALRVYDKASAQWLAQNYIDRAATIKDIATLEVGTEQFSDLVIGDRVALTAPWWGYSATPFEVIETHRDLQETWVKVSLASLNL